MADGPTRGGDDPAAPVGGRVGAGVRWSLLNNMALRLGTFASGLVLARLLSPRQYGVFAIALVVLTLVQSMNELGISLALVRWQGDVRTFAPTVMTLATGSSVLLYAGCWAAAPALAHSLGSPEAIGVIRVLCLGVIIDGLTTVPAGILNREFLQRKRFGCDLFSFVVTTSVTIGLAVGGSGAMSYAWGRLAGNTAMLAALLVVTPIRVRPGLDRKLVRPLLRFGLPLAGSSLLVLAMSNVDNIIVGATLNPVALGFYLMAFNQSSWPLTVFSDAARRVSLAGFSRLVEDPPALERAFARGLWLLLAAATAVCVGLMVYADPVLRFLYGEKWAPAAVALRWLAVLGLVRVAMFVAYDCLVAMGRSRALVGLQALWLAALIPALVVGANLDGIRGVSIAHVLVAVVVVVPAFLLTLHRLGIHARVILRDGVRPTVGGLLAAASGWPVLHLLHSAFARLAIGGLVLLAVYVPIVLPMRELMPGQRIGRHRSGRRSLRRPRPLLAAGAGWQAGLDGSGSGQARAGSLEDAGAALSGAAVAAGAASRSPAGEVLPLDGDLAALAPRVQPAGWEAWPAPGLRPAAPVPPAGGSALWAILSRRPAKYGQAEYGEARYGQAQRGQAQPGQAQRGQAQAGQAVNRSGPARVAESGAGRDSEQAPRSGGSGLWALLSRLPARYGLAEYGREAAPNHPDRWTESGLDVARDGDPAGHPPAGGMDADGSIQDWARRYMSAALDETVPYASVLYDGGSYPELRHQTGSYPRTSYPDLPFPDVHRAGPRSGTADRTRSALPGPMPAAPAPVESVRSEAMAAESVLSESAPAERPPAEAGPTEWVPTDARPTVSVPTPVGRAAAEPGGSDQPEPPVLPLAATGTDQGRGTR